MLCLFCFLWNMWKSLCMYSESELTTVLLRFGQDMRVNIFAFFFNQFSFSWLHLGVKQYGKFNFYVGLVNGVSWYLKRLKCKGSTSWFCGVKIELGIPCYVWKWFAILRLNR